MTLSEQINRMIQTVLESADFTSANPTHINHLIQINAIDNPDLEDELKDIIDDTSIKGNKEVKDNIKKVKKFDAGNVGEIQRMTTEQFSNIKTLVNDPVQLVFGALAKKIPKVVKGGVIAGIIFVVAEEVTKLIIEELQKPGRPFDIRLKRKIEDEIIIFRRREEKAKLLRGFSRMIITTMPGLRGGQHQASDTYRMLGGGGFIPGGESGIGAPQAPLPGGSILPPIETPPASLSSGAPSGINTKHRRSRGFNHWVQAAR